MNNPKFTLFKSTVNSQYYFNLKAANGENILSSESYIPKQGCLTGIAALKANAPYDSRYDRKNAFLNYTFNLKA